MIYDPLTILSSQPPKMKHRIPRGYWQIKRNVVHDAKKYKTSGEWKSNSPTAYRIAYMNNWMDECSDYFKTKSKVKAGYWQNKNYVVEDARKYNSRSEWKKNSNGGYQAAVRYGWLGQCCRHMAIVKGKWHIKENVIEDAKKYKSRSEWNSNSWAAYQSARKNGWLEKCCKHMVNKFGKWQVKSNVLNDSKKYKTRHEWIVNSNSAYQAASRNGWLGECHASKGAVISMKSSFK